METFFEWDPAELSVNVSAMDREHENLIAIMNRLHALREADAPADEMGKWVSELGRCTTEHFAHEEAYMDSIGFPKLEMHRKLHAKLLEKFAAHVAEFEASSELTDRFFHFLRFWLSSHIRGIDRQYSDPGDLAEPA